MEVRGQRTPRPLDRRPKVPDTSRIGHWLDVLEKLCPSRESNLGFVQPVTILTELPRPVHTLPVCLSPRHSLWRHPAVWYMVTCISEESIASVLKVFRVVRAIVADVLQDCRAFICSVTSQKTWIISSATLRTWNLTFIFYVYNKVGVTGCSETRLHDDITQKVTIVAKASNLKILALFQDAASTVDVIKGRT